MRVLVTGTAGFIGFHLADRLLKEGHEVLGYDVVNDYYDPYFKEIRLDILKRHGAFRFEKGALEDAKHLSAAWKGFDPEIVVHLAAQAGVRYSIENPMAYIHSNVVGFQNIIDLARETKPRNFLYASSSSVYGGITDLPFHEGMNVDKPISLYAATKGANELVAKTYSHLFGLPTTGFRFFTVYGPFGRPDMALFKFARALLRGEKLDVFNNGKMIRDFTFVDDIVDGIVRAMGKPKLGEVYNLGKGTPENLMDMVTILERTLGRTATLNMMPMQMGDVAATHAAIDKAAADFGYSPKTGIEAGIPLFARWFMDHAAERISR